MARDTGNGIPLYGIRRDGLRVVTGGQSGVDRAALDAALDGGVPCGGRCPAGRWAEDGPISARYPLVETPEADPEFRTWRNVVDGDGTLIIIHGGTDPGTRITIAAVRDFGSTYFALDLLKMDNATAVAKVAAWIAQENIRILNIAGPRESNAPGIYARAFAFLTKLYAALT